MTRSGSKHDVVAETVCVERGHPYRRETLHLLEEERTQPGQLIIYKSLLIEEETVCVIFNLGRKWARHFIELVYTSFQDLKKVARLPDGQNCDTFPINEADNLAVTIDEDVRRAYVAVADKCLLLVRTVREVLRHNSPETVEDLPHSFSVLDFIIVL
jgi:hypothetical protein